MIEVQQHKPSGCWIVLVDGKQYLIFPDDRETQAREAAAELRRKGKR